MGTLYGSPVKCRWAVGTPSARPATGTDPSRHSPDATEAEERQSAAGAQAPAVSSFTNPLRWHAQAAIEHAIQDEAYRVTDDNTSRTSQDRQPFNMLDLHANPADSMAHEDIIEADVDWSREDPSPRKDGKERDLIGQYLHDIGKYSLLTIDQERNLADRIMRVQTSIREDMLNDVAVIRQVAEVMQQIARHERRIERVLEVRVDDRSGKDRLRKLADANGATILGILEQVDSDQSCLSPDRMNRLMRLVDETRFKSREIEMIWHESSGSDKAVLGQIERYQQLRNTMVAANLRLAVSVARMYQDRGLPLLDLIQEASAGLFTAVDKFDPRRGLKFSTYATWWVKQSVRMAVSQKARLIRVGPSAYRRLRDLQTHAAELEQMFERPVQLEDVATLVKRPLTELKHYWTAGQEISSLDRIVKHYGDESHIDLLPTTQPVDYLQTVIQSETRQKIGQAMRGLSKREKQVIRLRYGLTDGIHRSLAEVGRKLSLTRERIRQIEESSLDKLRKSLSLA